jgi:hypothetical protein
LDLRTTLRKLAIITIPSMAIAGALVVGGIEVWVRARFDPRRGTPGFFLGDPTRGQRLAPGYTGWFAGVPVHINSLELRDDREYDLAKRPNTFRILFLGDSVTFGHGSVGEHAYPALLEQQLRPWRPDVDWQVWNAAVPGYNTSQELAHLLEVGPAFKPDLVVIGFFPNDLAANYTVVPAGRVAVAVSTVTSFLRRHVYSLEWYRRVFLTLEWKLSGSDEFQRRLDNLGAEDQLTERVDQVADLKEQAITPYERLTDEQVRRLPRSCESGQAPDPMQIPRMQSAPGWPAWVRAVRELQQLHKSGAYSILFFLNEVPLKCPNGDFFYDEALRQENDLFLRVMGDGTPIFSVFDTFLHRRPSQMPGATAHSIGNANMTKAEALFAYLTTELFPRVHAPLLAARDRQLTSGPPP